MTCENSTVWTKKIKIYSYKFFLNKITSKIYHDFNRESVIFYVLDIFKFFDIFD